MTTKLEQAARQILEAVEGIGFVSDYWDEKITALREALAEHEKWMRGEPIVTEYGVTCREAEQEHDGHWSDCSVHNEPAYPNGPCDCGGYPPKHWRCACGANLYIDSNGAPASKAEQVKQEELANVLVPWYAREDSTNVLAEQPEQEPIMRKTTRDEKIVRPGVYEVSVEPAEQEPVAWVDLEQWQSGEYDCFTSEKVAEYMTPLYATPVRTKDLTDDELSKLRHKIDWTAEWSYVNFARAVIAADREKNK